MSPLHININAAAAIAVIGCLFLGFATGLNFCLIIWAYYVGDSGAQFHHEIMGVLNVGSMVGFGVAMYRVLVGSQRRV